MRDSSETLRIRKLRKRQVDDEYARNLLGGQHLHLDDASIPWILNHIDCFVSQSRGNERVKEVHFIPHAFDAYDDDEIWDKVGQAICNLQKVENLHIRNPNYNYDDDDEVVPITDWKILARILSHMRQRITLNFNSHEDEENVLTWRAEDIRSFARAIHGHPTIIGFEGGEDFPYESFGALFSALSTLPALNSITLCAPILTQADETTLANPESLTDLLRVPSLRCVCFDHLSFTRALCQATANALTEGTAVTELEFRNCSFSAEECAETMANAFTRNTSLVTISVKGSMDIALFGALSAALPSNLTLRNLSFLRGISAEHLAPFFLALGRNTGLNALKVDVSGVSEGSLCTAIKDGLESNKTLERLFFKDISLCDDNADLYCRALSFLRSNKALKSLVVEMEGGVTESCLSAFRINIVAMLQENTSLESISFRSWNRIKARAEEFFVLVKLVTALQHNMTLKTLSLHYPNTNGKSLRLTDDQNKQMASLLKKNYALERLPDIDLENKAGDVGAILRLNEAGRRYLVQDGSSISKGVEVLSRVNSDDINCVFLHLLENPRLCDRSAVEMVTAGESSNGTSTIPAANRGGGKREQAGAHKDKESRRRLA